MTIACYMHLYALLCETARSQQKVFLLVFVALDVAVITHRRLRRDNVAREQRCALFGAV